STESTQNGHWARSPLDHLAGAASVGAGPRVTVLFRNLTAGSAFEMLVDVWRARSSNPLGESVGLSWQQGPLSTGAVGRFLEPEPLPKRLLYVERLRRRMRVRFGGLWIAHSEDVLLLFEPGRYPVTYFPETDVSPHLLERTEHTTQYPDL